MADAASRVSELRLVLRVEDPDALAATLSDELGLTVLATFGTGGARAVLLEAGRATIEVGNAEHADGIDELETGSVTGAPVRLALGVDATDELTATLRTRGLEVVGPPATMPWGSRNARVVLSDDLQLTLFELDDEERFV
jgi:hypothetical protein